MAEAGMTLAGQTDRCSVASADGTGARQVTSACAALKRGWC